MPEPSKDMGRQMVRATQAGEGEVAELLAFSCNDEPYAVSLGSVHEIVIPPPITMVPRSPHPVLGVCSVRGELATVVDLRRILGVEEGKESIRYRILLARLASGELVGLRVDEVKQVVRLTPNQIEYSSQSLGGDVSEGVRGIGRPSPNEVIVILDLVAVLAKGCS